MAFAISPAYEAAILRQYEKNIARYPLIREDVEPFLAEKDRVFRLCVQYLYGHMVAQDILSFPAQVFAGYVEASLQAWEQLDYIRTVPAEIFFPYVLYHRVNSECLDDSRGVLLKELLPFVQGKTMEQAALAVNYWCYAHATYTPADDRTLGPLAVLRRTLGRCGEESVLAVAALRSVGIPARQCYCPRWSHCDDNHAWVEVWIDGDWHYMGACEPEPALDRGWFTAAASRAMLVDTKCWADWQNDTLYEPVFCTSRYAKTKTLTVQVTDGDLPVFGARVRFQIVNYSQLYTLWEEETDAQGLARFETGLGDLFIYARHGRKVALQKMDLRQQDFVVLELKNAFPAQLAADLVPPEDSSKNIPYPEDGNHQRLLALCEARLATRRAAFPGEADLRQAALNAPEVRAFLEADPYPLAQKQELLATLRPKDFADITREVLLDALDAAAPARGHYPEDIFRDFILSPRICDEMLLPERKKIRELFPGGFTGPEEIRAWMRDSMEILPDKGIHAFYPSAFGCLRCRQVPAFAFDMVFVALCRAFCFPARLDSATGKGQWMSETGRWHSIYPEAEPVHLKLEFPGGRKLNYPEHITLGLWNGEDFVTLQYPGLSVETGHTFCLQPGLYRVTATTRQIDGTASAILIHLELKTDRVLRLTPPEDQTALRLKKIPLQLPEGKLQEVFQAAGDKKQILLFSDPGSEPTEHLLREMLECAEAFHALPCRILLFAEDSEDLTHPTVQLLKAALPEMECHCLRDPDALAALYLQMQVGDLRLPFVLCVDRQGNGIYADANYRIGMAQTLLEVQKLL